MKNWNTVITLFFIWLFCLNLDGQSLIIDTVQVQQDRIPLTIKETGKSITVIDQQAIAGIPAQSIDDLLNYIPGIEIQSRGGFGTQADITMRGSTFPQVLILLDGMKINDPLTSHFNGNLPVTKSEISGIEVLRGAASAQYGADAVGGVINIITKAFSKKSELDVISGEVGIGSNKLVDLESGFHKSADKFVVSGGLHYAKSDGEMIEGNDKVEAYNTFFDIKTAGLAAQYKFSDAWTLKARSSFDSREFSARYYYTTSPFDKSVETVKKYWNQLSITQIKDQHSTDFNLAHKTTTDEFIFSPDFPSTNSHTTQLVNFQVNHNRTISDFVLLNGGVQFDKRSIESNDRGDHDDIHFGMYSSAHISPSQNLSLIASLRLDQDENFGTALLPQFNVSYQLNKLTLRASAGKSIRAADYTERFVSTNLQNLTPGRSLGNPDLMAEESWSYEAGLDIKLKKGLFLQSTLFTRQSSQLIDYIATNSNEISNNENLAAGETYFFASNISDVTTQGLELSVLSKIKISERLSLKSSLGYTYLNSSNEEEVLSVYISSHAKHAVNSYVNILNPRFTLNLSGIYKMRDTLSADGIGQVLNSDYFSMNVALTHLLYKGLDMSFKVYNLWDSEYQNVLGAPMPGRWFSFGLKVNL